MSRPPPIPARRRRRLWRDCLHGRRGGPIGQSHHRLARDASRRPGSIRRPRRRRSRRSASCTRSTTGRCAPARPKIGASLAESWTESPDGLVYEFKLRRGLKFHNGDPVTTEDVKFSFERYKGAGRGDLQDRVAQVEIVDPWSCASISRSRGPTS